MVVLPKQMEIPCPAFTFGNGFTFTLIVSVCEQPLTSVPVTWYVVVAGGDAVTLEPVLVLKPVVGDH